MQAQEHLARSEVDLALAAYRRIQPVSPRILNLIGQIYTEQQNDNEHALECHMQALKMQEKVNKKVQKINKIVSVFYRKVMIYRTR
jgi:tetratricopeptide (TPR) repeat protein